MTYDINLTFQQTLESVPARSSGYRLVATAAALSGFADSGVFVLQKISDTESQFTCVASVPQMFDLRVGVPDPDTGYFRSATVDLVVGDMDTLQSLEQLLIFDVRFLCHEMTRVDSSLTAPTSITVSSTDSLG